MMIATHARMMSALRWVLCIATVPVVRVAAAPVHMGDEPPVGLVAVPAELETIPPEADTAPDLTASELGQTCLDFGGSDLQYPTYDPRYRGNAYRMLYDATLTEIRMAFKITLGSSADLYFSIHRRPSTNVTCSEYVRVIPDVFVQAAGTGTRVYYSTGPLSPPLQLEEGYDYAIAVGWKSLSVWYYLDDQDYPQPFLHGEVLGSVAKNVAPPLEHRISQCTFCDGAYMMQLCFMPTAGACCVYGAGLTGDCAPFLASECTAAGSFFHGERVACADVLCQFGACCYPCGGEDCADHYTPETCADMGGEWAGHGAVCTPVLCPKITGACCVGALCSEVCADECAGAGGVYNGDGTTCEPNVCAGACCVTGTGCGDLSSAQLCTAITGGIFKGPGTTCDALPPGSECGGPCCFKFLNTYRCIKVLSRSLCTEAQGLVQATYLGDALECTTTGVTCHAQIIASRGACCLPDGSCAVTTPSACSGPAFAGGYECNEVTCTACCVGSECTMTPDEQSCTDPSPAGLGGTARGEACVPNPCTIPRGACCFNDGSCLDDVSGEECAASGGRFQEGEDCLSCPASFGACCLPNGTCVDKVTDAECAARGADPATDYIDGQDCDSPNLECPELGACCTSVGNCFFILPELCTTINGFYRGPGVTCQENTCPVGACCIENECVEVTLHGCAALQGVYRGSNTHCDESVVCGDILGACCKANGSCELVLPQQCRDVSGIFLGSGSGCAAGLCTRGACCHLDGTCEGSTVAPLCTDQEQGDVFHPGKACAVVCHPRGACCLEGRRCEERSLQTACQDADGIYGGDGSTCVPGLCTPGACCLPDETCDDTLTHKECEAADGVYQGTGTECVPGLCTLGACCHLNGVCDNSCVASECVQPFDEFFHRFECRDIPCLARGACCVAEQCQDELTRQQCESRGGTYHGDGTLCRDDLCTIGACCRADSTCDHGLSRQLCERNAGLYLGPGTRCDDTGVDCTRGSCCSAWGVCQDDAIPALCAAPEDFRADRTCGTLACVARGACCLIDGPGPCRILPRTQCLSSIGVYDGNATTCAPDDFCVQGACCMLNETCQTKTRQRCERALGTYVGAGEDCASADCVRGACCQLDGTCQDDAAGSECADLGAEFHGGLECVDIPCAPRGACCLADESCQILPAEECVDPAKYRGDGTPCGPGTPCAWGACCLPDGGCSDVLAFECIAPGADFHPGVDCASNPCATVITVVSSDPPNCAIDARQPSNPNGSNPAGWRSISVTFDGDATGLAPTDFTVEVQPGPATAPAIIEVNPTADPNTVTLELDGFIPTGKWTRITHNDSGTRVCLGYLPADVNSDRTSGPVDILAVIDNLNGQVQPPYPIRQCDVDRSNVCGPADILRVIDLLNGADAYETWLGRSIPLCPSSP